MGRKHRSHERVTRLQNLQINLPYEAIADFCRRWKILRLEVFGSVLRDDFRPDSDLDFLVSFAPDSNWSLFDLVRAEDDLSEIVGRKVDLVEREPVERSDNWIRRRAILSAASVLYVA